MGQGDRSDAHAPSETSWAFTRVWSRNPAKVRGREREGGRERGRGRERERSVMPHKKPETDERELTITDYPGIQTLERRV